MDSVRLKRLLGITVHSRSASPATPAPADAGYAATSPLYGKVLHVHGLAPAPPAPKPAPPAPPTPTAEGESHRLRELLHLAGGGNPTWWHVPPRAPTMHTPRVGAASEQPDAAAVATDAGWGDAEEPSRRRRRRSGDWDDAGDDDTRLSAADQARIVAGDGGSGGDGDRRSRGRSGRRSKRRGGGRAWRDEALRPGA